MLGGVLDRVVIWEISLQDYFAGGLASSGASGNLGQQLECALGGAEIREAQGSIRSHHSYQRHAVDVVSFGDHLRAHQHVKFAFIERIQCALKVLAPAYRIAIQAADARLGKHSMEQLF